MSRPGEEVRFEVELRAIRDGDEWRTASGRAAMLVEGLVPDLAAGDRFRAFAHLLPPEHALNPGEADRAEPDRGRRITSHLRVNYPEAISVVSTGFAFGPTRLLESLRLRGRQVFAKYLRPQQANLAAAVLLGLREQLDRGRNRGLSTHGHDPPAGDRGAASGHSRRFRRPGPPPPAAVAMGPARRGRLYLLYMLLVDAQPPVVRATVLIVAACGAVYFGRRRVEFQCLGPGRPDRAGPQSGRSVQCRAAAFLLVRRRADGHGAVVDGDDARPGQDGSPDRNRRRSHWQQGGLLVRLPRWLPRWVLPERQPAAIEKLLEQERPWAVRMLWLVGRFLRRLTLVSGAIWLLTLPLVMARFHIFNPIAVLINTAVWLPMAGALVSGLALLLCSMLPGPLAAVFAAVLQLATRRRRVAGAVRRARALRT